MARTAPVNMRSLVLRAMAVRDVPAVGRIDLRAFGSDGGWPESAFQAELRENRLARYFVVEESPGSPLGYIGCWVIADAVHIVTIGVDPEAQRCGLGALLVMRALELALEAGVPGVTLECRASNVSAQALYGKHGFQIVGRHRRYYADKEDALIMTRIDDDPAAARTRLQGQRHRHHRAYGAQVTQVGG